MGFYRIGIAVIVLVFLANAIDITIDANVNRKSISPWIYGRNNSLSTNPSDPVASGKWKLYRDAGVRMFRENAGNNNTKYNWRLRLTSAPDWYNNVYTQDWDYLAKSFQDSTAGAQILLGFQLLGKAAANTNNNFNDWDFNQSQWWSGVNQNLAGGGVVEPAGGDKAKKDGDINLYLKDWPADSSVAILDHFFGTGGLGLDKQRFLYWNMDNEPEIWNSTHNDVVTTNIAAEDFMQKYFKVAKAARQKFPEIKLVGFIACNEWQWYAWNNAVVSGVENGTTKKYTWLEFFLKRIGQEQRSSGIRLLDVLDFHFYPEASSNASLTLQLHRVWFDTTYVFPLANGCHLIGGEWDVTINREFIGERSRRWLNQFLGADHGVTLGISECGNIYGDDPNVVAVWYASHLGTFANEGVELFTPWQEYIGQFEALHLFSRYAGNYSVQSISTMDSLVSAYSSINAAVDTLTTILVNRDQTNAQNVSVEIKNFQCSATGSATFQLSGLTAGTESFKSHTDNALKKGTATLTGNGFSLSLPKLSVTAVRIPGKGISAINEVIKSLIHIPEYSVRGTEITFKVGEKVARLEVSLFDVRGKVVRSWTRYKCENATFSLAELTTGRYVVEVNGVMLKKPLLYVK